MKAQFKILSGSRKGQVEVHSRSEISVGRHPECDMRFDPDADLEVSTRHAMIVRSGNSWVVRDLHSRNGTLVNGHKIVADTKLSDTDQIRFGKDGPNLEFRTVADSLADTAPATFEHASSGPVRASTANRSTPSAAAPAAGRVTAPAGGSTTQRIRVEVAKQTQKLRRVSITLVVVLLLGGAAVLAWTWQQNQRRGAEAQEMRARVDSILRASDEAVKALQGQVAGLADALRKSQTEVQQLQTDLASAQASGNRAQVAELSRKLNEASDVLRNQQAAAQVNFRGINSANQHAVALVYVQFEGGDVFTGTAFSVRKDGLLVTNRHVVAGDDGTRKAVRIGLKFADSYQVLRTSLVKVLPDADLALIRVDNLVDSIPVVHGVNAGGDMQPGDPVALIGFPLGVDLPQGNQGGREIAKTTLGLGTVSKVLPDRVQVDGYSAQGASGSPIFDRNGDVIAVLYGGQEGSNGRILYGIPASYISRLLQ